MKAYELVKGLNDEEPDYKSLAKHPDTSTEKLLQLLNTADGILAAKIACLAGHMGGKAGLKIIQEAAAHASEVVRLGAAIGVCRLPVDLNSSGKKKPVRKLIVQLLGDSAPSVRNTTVTCLCSKVVGTFRSQLKKIVREDTDEFVKAAAEDRLNESDPVSKESGETEHSAQVLGDHLEVLEGGALLMTSDVAIPGDDQVIATDVILPGDEI